MKTVIKAEIVAHSINEQGDELISVMATFPRFILAEVNTHRMLSKNTSSSRAIPFNKMVDTIKNDPFIPIAWQKEHKGMQGYEYIIDKENIQTCTDDWLIARNSAIESAKNLNKGFNRKNEQGNWIQTEEIDFTDKVTKQLCNRLLEPFMWTTMLITGPKSGWENFFNLRCPSYTFHTDESEKDFVFRSKKDAINYFPADEVVEYSEGNVLLKDLSQVQWLQVNTGQAEIHMMALAECIWDAVNESTPKVLKSGEWHVPFIDKFDNYSNKKDGSDFDLNDIKISVSLAARTSYTVVGEEKEIDYKKMVELHDRLLAQDPPHSSPFEHTCQVVTEEEYNNSLKGQEKGWFRNYKGFKSYRQIIEENK